MKKAIIGFLFIFSLHSFTSAQVTDSSGYVIVKNQLAIIKNFLANPNSDTTLKRVSVIKFLTILTGITSESDGNYIGQLNPTQNDYTLWERWLILNQESIYWDKKTENIIIHKTVKPPKF